MNSTPVASSATPNSVRGEESEPVAGSVFDASTLGCVTVGLKVVVVVAATVVEVVEVFDPAAVGAGATGVPATAFDAGESPFALTALMVTE